MLPSFPDKPALRRHFLALRAALPAEERARAEKAIAAHARALIPAGAAVAGYLPMRGEADILPLLEALARSGHSICLPCVAQARAPLLFRRWQPGMALASAIHDTQEPEAHCEPCDPQVVLVPLLAFNRRGFRIGYGGGYYDRSLEALRARPGFHAAIGIGFACQEAEFAPEPHDARLDAIVTERGAIDASSR